MTDQIDIALAVSATDEYKHAGLAIVVHSASHAFKVSFDNENFIDVNEGSKLALSDGFESVWVKNPSGVDALTAVIYYGDNNLQSTANSVTILSASSTLPVEIMNPADVVITGTFTQEVNNTITSLPDKALVALAVAAVISAFAATKRETIITNPVGNGSIRIGGSTTGAAAGVELAEGASITLDGNTALYAYSAASQSISITEVHTV